MELVVAAGDHDLHQRGPNLKHIKRMIHVPE
jgi:hypothetical protein